MRVFHYLRCRSSFCTDDQNDSIIALGRASPTDPTEGISSTLRTLSVTAHEVNCLDSVIGVHDALRAHGALTHRDVKGLMIS